MRLLHGGRLQWPGLEVARVVDDRVDPPELCVGEITEGKVCGLVIDV